VELFGETVSVSSAIFLVLALLLALSFEFVNGFHDTANAVATVIYTHSLKANYAVVWSGVWNLIGVLTSSGAVAYSIVSLLPVELVLNVGSGAGFAMVFSLLLAAIIWNLGTWWLGIPASSSHTLVGSIMGVGLANSLIAPGHVFGEGVNWAKAADVFKSLLFSPIFGFFAAAALLWLCKLIIKNKALYDAPEPGKAPPWWIRLTLIGTCTGVSFAHGSNDGQKGMGLIVLILVGILPGAFALNPAAGPGDLQAIVNETKIIQPYLDKQAPLMQVSGQDAIDEMSDYMKPTGKPTIRLWDSLAGMNRQIGDELNGKTGFHDLTSEQRKNTRRDIYLFSESMLKLIKKKEVTDPTEVAAMSSLAKKMSAETKYIPTWVKVAVALALGLGTMIGWKRIVVTVGEKIGKTHLTYAQGAAAELVAMGTILTADNLGLPVSTTHILSSGVAGTMWANKSGLQGDTVRSILLAWVLTLPVCVLLGSALFAGSFYLLLSLFGVK
jgi:inorganic phosphate transporter, PiT family